MTETHEIVRQEPQADEALSLVAVRQQVTLIQHVLREVMALDVHYGKIPGTDKPALLKAGAEKLSLTFRLAPTYDIREKDLPNGHREYVITCTLTHIPTGRVFGQGVGSCSTMEKKYRYRPSERKCPQCGKPAIIKGKAEYGGGFVCFKKKDGCGAKFGDNDKSITDQPAGQTENPDLADCFNTVLKMAKKRAHVDACLTSTAASDIFSQDLEETIEPEPEPPPRREEPPEPPPKTDEREQRARDLFNLARAPKEKGGAGMALPHVKRWMKRLWGVDGLLALGETEIADAEELIRCRIQGEHVYEARAAEMRKEGRIKDTEATDAVPF